MNQDRQQKAEHMNQRNDESKTILLIGGRSGDGKSSFTGHLGGKFKDDPRPSLSGTCARLYISKQHKLRIIDAKGLESSKNDRENQKLINEICEKSISYGDSALDAIIIMWSPKDNGHLVLYKTIKALQEPFGKYVTKSCIFMIQGNWETPAPDLDRAKISDQIKEIEQQVPHVPIIKYEAHSPAKEVKKLLDDTMKKIEPFKVETFKKQQKEQPEKKPQEKQEKLPKLKKKREERKDEEKSEERKEERKEEEKEKEQAETIQPNQPSQPVIQQERVPITFMQRIRPMLKSGAILTGSGIAVGMTAIAFEQSIALAAGTIGITAGALCFSAAAGTGAFHGLSWAVRRARGIRA